MEDLTSDDERANLAGAKKKQEVNTLPIVDPTPAESRGVAPQASYKEHFIWTLKSDTYILLYKLMFSLIIGMFLFFIATLNVWAFFALAVIWPLILLFINQFIYKSLLIGFGFQENPLAFVKYTTFALQNLALCVIYWYGTDELLSHVVTWVIRLNVFEVGIACIVQRLYVLWIPTILLLIPLCGWQQPTWTFTMVKHERYLMVWIDWNPWFIIIYTGWFLGWIIRGSERIPTALHTLFPLFFAPQLWMIVRTFCGSFLLWWLYITPLQPYVSNPESLHQQSGFSEIFDALYIIVFLAAYSMSFCMKYINDIL